MEVKAVPLNKRRHYPMMQRWWEEREFRGASLDFTPDKGCMVYVNGKPIFGAFLIETNANLAIIDYGASDPKAPKKEREIAFEACFKSLYELARILGYKMVSAASNLKSVGDRYERFGLVKFDENVTIYGGFTCHRLQ